jgi:hypothetical protein
MNYFTAKEIRHNKYRKFYKTYSKEAMPLLGTFFLDIYNCINLYQRTLQRAEKSRVLKDIIFQYCLDEAGGDILHKISEGFIKQKSSVYSIEELTARTKENIAETERYFNTAWRKSVDDVYKNIVHFNWFVNFDYTGIIQRFSGSRVTPHGGDSLNRVKGSVICEQLKDFLTITPVLEERIDWNGVFAILRQFDASFQDEGRWLRLFPALLKVIKSQILVFIIRHIEENPDWTAPVINEDPRFVDEYINTLVAESLKMLEDIERNETDNMIQELVLRVFPEGMSSAAYNYSESEIELYDAGDTAAASTTKQFNYLFSFLHAYCDQIREMISVILIKASWVSREYSGELSGYIHGLNSRYIELAEFDKSLGDRGERGIKLRTYLSKASIGKRHSENLRKYILTINVEAYTLVERAKNSVIVFQKQITILNEEREKRQQNFIRNWTELEGPLKEQMPMQVCVQKINDLINLLHYLENIAALKPAQ